MDGNIDPSFLRQLSKRVVTLKVNTILLTDQVSILRSKLDGTQGTREISVAITKLEEAEMWLTKALGPMGYVPEVEEEM